MHRCSNQIVSRPTNQARPPAHGDHVAYLDTADLIKVDGTLMTAKTRRKPALPAAHLRLAYSAPAAQARAAAAPNRSSTVAELRRLTMPATKALPFVKLHWHDQPWVRPASYWNVKPVGKRPADLALGRSYARAAIAAMKKDQNSQLIALILQDIIQDTLARLKGRRARDRAALGFLYEISEAIAAT